MDTQNSRTLKPAEGCTTFVGIHGNRTGGSHQKRAFKKFDSQATSQFNKDESNLKPDSSKCLKSVAVLVLFQSFTCWNIFLSSLICYVTRRLQCFTLPSHFLAGTSSSRSLCLPVAWQPCSDDKTPGSWCTWSVNRWALAFTVILFLHFGFCSDETKTVGL